MPSDWRGCGHWTNQTRTLRESEGKCDQVSTTTRTTTRTTRTMKMLFIPPQRLASLWAQQECQANGRPAANSVARTCKQTTMTKGTQKNQDRLSVGRMGIFFPLWCVSPCFHLLSKLVFLPQILFFLPFFFSFLLISSLSSIPFPFLTHLHSSQPNHPNSRCNVCRRQPPSQVYRRHGVAHQDHHPLLDH